MSEQINFGTPRYSYGWVPEKYNALAAGEYMHVREGGEVERISLTQFLRRKGLVAGVDFQTTVHKDNVYVKRLADDKNLPVK